jgi:ABC-2 type transport system permease protein
VTALLRIARAEGRMTLGDPGVLLVLVGAIVLYSLFYPLPYLPQVLKDVPVVPVDLDGSSFSRRLLRMIDADELVRLAKPASGVAEAEARVRAGEAGGVVVVPRDFERDILRGRQVTVAAMGDASYFLIYRQAVTGMLQATGTFSAGVEIKRLRLQGASAAQAYARRDPLPLELRPLYNPSMGYASYVVPAVFVLILQQTLLIGIGMARGTERERRQGRAMRGLPRESGAVEVNASDQGGPEARDPSEAVSGRSGDSADAPGPWTLVLGRALFYLALYAVHALFYFGILFRLYRFPERAAGAVLGIFLLPFLLASIFLGLALAGVFRRREASMQALLFTSIPAVFLAGFSWPVEAMPRWLGWLARLLPSTAGIEGFLRLTQMGVALQSVRGEWIMLWVLAGLYLVLAWLSTRRDKARSAGSLP